MAIAQQTEQLFARVFGRSAESPEERNFLKDLEGRKGIGTAASQGALEFAQKQGTFGGFSQTGAQGQPGRQEIPPEPSTIDAMSSGMDLIKKKMVEMDKLEKKLFREEQKLTVKQQMLSDPGFKKLLETRGDLREQLNTKDFQEEIPVTPGITNPLDAARAAIGQQAGIAGFVQNATQLAESGEESVVNILDRLGDQRTLDYQNARNQFTDLLTLNQEMRAERGDLRAEEMHKLTMEQSKLEIKQLEQQLKDGGMTPQQRAQFFLDWMEQGGDPQDASTMLNFALGNQANLPLVENNQKGGYQFGEDTFYGKQHAGVDIVAPAGSKIRANTNLTVETVKVGSEGGLQVWARDDQGNRHRYLHLGGLRQGLTPGAKIQAGQIIGTVGTPKQHSPNEISTGSHLHYDVSDPSGKFIDPKKLKPTSAVMAKQGPVAPDGRGPGSAIFDTQYQPSTFGFGEQDVENASVESAVDAALRRRQENLGMKQQQEIDFAVQKQKALESGKRDSALENVQGSVQQLESLIGNVNKHNSYDAQKKYILDLARADKDFWQAKFSDTAELALATGNITGSTLLGPTDARIEAMGGIGLAALKDDNVAQYQAVVNALLPFMLVKSLGESGRLSDQDIKAAKAALPTMLDTKAIAEKKMNQIRQKLGEINPADLLLIQEAQQYLE